MDEDEHEHDPGPNLSEGLLRGSRGAGNAVEADEEIGTASLWKLYLSHTLSTWNARTYEFAAILFTASAFPDTLLASSIRGLCNTLVALCLSPIIGRWIDHAPSRLRTLLITITANRAAVILACFGWLFLVSGVDRLSSQSVYKWAFIVRSLNFRGSLDSPEDIRGSGPLLAQVKTWLFAVVIFLGSMEKLSGVANTISMERDWIPALVAKSPGGESSPTQLTQLNAVMRRIDLVCKLVGPVVISVIISLTSTRIGVFTIAALNTLTWGIEMWSARRVWDAYPQLRQRSVGHFVEEIEMSSMDSQPSFQPSAFNVDAAQWCTSQWVQVRGYFLTDVWIPSLSLALLHVSVLTYNATLITYLLNTGFSLILITITRSLSSILEVSSTFVAPISVEYLGRSQKESPPLDGAEALLLEHDLRDQKHGVGLERSGLWAVCSQLINLIPVVLAIWQISPPGPDSAFMFLVPTSVTRIASFALFTFLSVSRLGLWTFDLITQELTQTRVPPQTRSSFAGTEMAFVSFFELTQWIVAAIWSRPDEFRWLATGSLCAVAVSAAAYTGWVRRRRGHLVHWERCGVGWRPRHGR